MARLRAGFRCSPVAFPATLLAFAWIALNVYETAVHWNGGRFGLGWFDAVSQTVSLSAIGVLLLAGIVWLIERVSAPR
ncbi:MAG TPA: hypothetical protein VGL44_14705 [Gaiellales bacterium]